MSEDDLGSASENNENTNKAMESNTEANILPMRVRKSPRELYFEQLELWVKQANLSLNAMTCFPYYLMANYPNLLNGTVPMNSPVQSTYGIGSEYRDGIIRTNNIINNNNNSVITINRNRGRADQLFDNQVLSDQIIIRNGGYEYVVAPLWKRFVAEVIDVGILFIIKLMVAFMIVELFEIDIGFDFESIRSSIEEDYTEFLIFSSEMIYVEILTKILVCIYEAMWTRQGQQQIGGATPGKTIMGIRILYVEAVIALEPQNGQQQQQPQQQQAPQAFQFNNFTNTQPIRALLYPAQNPGFKRALARAVSKNLLMALLFPLCFIILFFRNNRTSYDLMTNTIVVEENPAPVLRRVQINT